MDIQTVILVLSFVCLLAVGMPVAFALGISAAVAFLSMGSVDTAPTVARVMSNGIESFTLLAIPFFVIAGELMGRGGMARRLIALADLLVGRFRCGLALVNTLTCMLFGSISGSATAAVSSVGGFMIPEMKRAGYKPPLAVAITATSATTGLIIPPSNVMIVYAVTANNVSIAALFLAGVIPGIVTGLLIMLTSIVVLRNMPAVARPRRSLPEARRIALGAIPSIGMLLIVLGGIFSGAFSATEASAVAVAYAWVVGLLVHRELSMKDLPGILLRSARTTGIIFILIAGGQVLARVLTMQHIPQQLADAMLALSSNPIVLLMIINLTLLAIGTFLDMTPAVLIFTPIFLPVAMGLGIDPVHFGIILIVNLCIGLCTPPVGTCLFVGCTVGRTSIERTSLAMVPYWIAMIAALALVSAFSAMSLWLPRVAGWM